MNPLEGEDRKDTRPICLKATGAILALTSTKRSTHINTTLLSPMSLMTTLPVVPPRNNNLLAGNLSLLRRAAPHPKALLKRERSSLHLRGRSSLHLRVKGNPHQRVDSSLHQRGRSSHLPNSKSNLHQGSKDSLLLRSKDSLHKSSKGNPHPSNRKDSLLQNSEDSLHKSSKDSHPLSRIAVNKTKESKNRSASRTRDRDRTTRERSSMSASRTRGRDRMTNVRLSRNVNKTSARSSKTAASSPRCRKLPLKCSTKVTASISPPQSDTLLRPKSRHTLSLNNSNRDPSNSRDQRSNSSKDNLSTRLNLSMLPLSHLNHPSSQSNRPK